MSRVDPRLAGPIAELLELCMRAEDYNSPLKFSEKVGGRTQPGSRAPGEQQCEWLVRRLESILIRANREFDEVLAAAQKRSTQV